MSWEQADGVNRFIARRPLALFAGCYGVGAVSGYYGHVPVVVWGLGAVLVGVGLLVRRRAVFWFLLAMFVGAAITSWCAGIPNAIPEESVVIEGVVASDPTSNELRTVITVTDASINQDSHPHLIRLYIYGEPIYARMGDKVRLTGETWLPQGRRNPGGFDFAAWMWAHGGVLCATGRTDSVSVERPRGFSFLGFIGLVRENMGEAIDRLFGEQAPLTRALIMGDRNALSDEIEEDFQTAGITHLLAISGLHVSCLAVALEWLLQRLGRSRRQAMLITVGILSFYAVLVGLPASVVRSMEMFLLMRGAVLTGRPPDSLTGLAAAFLFLVIFRPLSIADTGFQLSFSAIAAMLLVAEPVGKLLHIPYGFLWPGFRKPKAALRWIWAWVCALFAASIAIQLVTLPIIAQTFGMVSMYAPLINLVAIPLTTLMLPLVMLKLAVGSVIPAIGTMFTLPDVLLKLLTDMANRTAQAPYGLVNVPHWPFLLVIAYLAVCFGASPYVKFSLKVRKFFLGALVLMVIFSFGYARLTLPDGLHIAFLDAGQADAMVIRAQGRTYLMDVGKENSPTDEYLAYTGQGIDAVFLTHPHADHVGGLKELARRMRIPKIYIPECWDKVEPEGDIISVIEKLKQGGTEVEKIAAGDVVALSDQITLTVLQPEAGYIPKSGNGGSMVVQITYGDGSALLTGDLPSDEELKMYPDVDIMKAAHHGAKSSNSDLMLHMAHPSAMVISVGRNGYGHPAERVISAAQDQNAAVYRTDACGAVFAQIEPSGLIRMETFLHQGLTAEGEQQ